LIKGKGFLIKMALKDWNKIGNTNIFQKNSYYRWRNKNNASSEIIIIKEFDDYSVIITRDAKASKREYFSTLTKAITYAKSYMRTH